MLKGICNLSVVPMRRIPSDKGEMVSQLLFGETFTITDTLDNWILVKNDFEGYEGWLDKKQIRLLTDNEFQSKQINKSQICLAPFSQIKNSAGETFFTSFGSEMHSLSDNDMLNPVEIYQFTEDFGNIEFPDKTKVIEFARLFVNVPYLWGGKSFFGVDCSGLVQLVFKASGIQLPRDANEQMEIGTLVGFIEQSEPADLAFFDNDEGQIVHVGILLNQSQIIHASGKVRIDSIDHYGIFSHELHRYTHRLRLIKRL